jgi:hypothetical protein
VTPRTLPHSSVPLAQRKTTPEMPRIPGVNDKPEPTGFQPKPLIAVILAVVLCAGAFALWLSHRRRADLTAAPAVAAAPAASISDAPSKTNSEPNAITTLDELAKTWSSKKFNFVDPKTHDSVAAIVIHLPSSGAGESFWAFSLKSPFSQCPLQYVTDLSALSHRFAYSAEHPMVVSDCDGILYDPLKIATLPDGSWVRGDIVRGGGIRPPISISVRIRDRELIAERME